MTKGRRNENWTSGRVIHGSSKARAVQPRARKFLYRIHSIASRSGNFLLEEDVLVQWIFDSICFKIVV